MSAFFHYAVKWRKSLKVVFLLYFAFLTFLLVRWKSDRQLLLRPVATLQLSLIPENKRPGGADNIEVLRQGWEIKDALDPSNVSRIFRWGPLDEAYQQKFFSNKKEYCNGAFVGVNALLAILTNVTIDPKFGHGRLGGENISAVINQAEEDEYYKLGKGYFSVKCSGGISYSFTSKSHLNKWREATQAVSVLPEVGSVVSDWTIAIMRYEYANLYHTMTDFYAAFLAAKSYKMNPDKVTLFWIDGHPEGALDGTWKKLFGNVTRAGQLKTPVRFRKMVWGIMGYDSPLNKHDSPYVPYLEEFRSFFLTRHGLADKEILDCKRLKILFLWRRDYLAHPRNPTGKVTRKIKNEDELVTSIKELLPGHRVAGIQIDKLPMTQQLREISTTDILIGMHGAGLSHTLFLPKHAGLVELFPTYWPTANKHFRSMARWRHIHYATWSNSDHSRELPNHYTIVDVKKVINMVHEIHHKICGELADEGNS